MPGNFGGMKAHPHAMPWHQGHFVGAHQAMQQEQSPWHEQFMHGGQIPHDPRAFGHRAPVMHGTPIDDPLTPKVKFVPQPATTPGEAHAEFNPRAADTRLPHIVGPHHFADPRAGR